MQRKYNILLHTPVASEHKVSATQKQYRSTVHRGGQVHLSQQLAALVKRDGKLNPEFVEQMMGFPAGWTELNHSTREAVRALRLKSSVKKKNKSKRVP